MKVYFDTLGCMKNVNDSDIAQGYVKAGGHEVAKSPEEADVIVVNTCGFIEDAKKESISEIFAMAEYKAQGKKLLISGCMVQRYAKELYEEIPEADGFLGVNDYRKLPEILNRLASEERPLETGHGIDDTFEEDSEFRVATEGAYSASLRISEGCNRKCAYCVIPKIRGPYRSRTKESILEEAKRLAAAGTKEISVIAEDTGCYGVDLYGKPVLGELLRALCQVDGIQWIRVMYCYEDHINEELIRAMAEEPKICHYIDIPLQHASDKVLREMNRSTTQARMRETVRRLREAMPDITIRTTMIVGFPGETDEEFEELMDFCAEARFDRLGAFTYSREEGAPAYDREDQIPEDIKQSRLDRLMLQQMQISLEKNQEQIGKTVEVLVDGLDEDGVTYIGRTRRDAPEIDDSVLFTSEKNLQPGDFVRVEIVDAFDYDLVGTEV